MQHFIPYIHVIHFLNGARLHLQVPTWRTSGSMAWTTRWRSATNREAVMAGNIL
jgi:hypothetical protein